MEEQVKLLEENEYKTESRRAFCFVQNRILYVYLIAIHILLVASFFGAWTLYSRQHESNPAMLLPSELPFAAHAVEYEDVVFDPSGFSLDGSHNAYEGEPTPAKNKLWRDLYSVGMASITEQEYKLLNNLETVQVGEHRIVTMEVFHQLHCVDYLRQRLYERDGKPFNAESEWSREHHLTHCIDYLRQVLMCHGDLTPITLTRDEPNGRPHPNFHIRHTCRKFDRLWEFAQERNVSGMRIA